MRGSRSDKNREGQEMRGMKRREGREYEGGSEGRASDERENLRKFFFFFSSPIRRPVSKRKRDRGQNERVWR